MSKNIVVYVEKGILFRSFKLVVFMMLLRLAVTAVPMIVSV